MAEVELDEAGEPKARQLDQVCPSILLSLHCFGESFVCILFKGRHRGQPDPARPRLLGGAGGVGGQDPRDGVHLDALPARRHRPLGHLHPEQGDPAQGNGSSLLQQEQPAEQHGAQVNISDPIQ